jgi:hypothetical protein
LQLGVRRSSRCARLHADAIEHAPKPSQRLGQRLYDALRRSKLKFAGRRFHGLFDAMRELVPEESTLRAFVAVLITLMAEPSEITGRSLRRNDVA